MLNKLAEMGDEPDRRMFLDQLFAFMEEIRTPIISIPMISKTAIDLYRLYHLVREHGGMVEVSVCSFNTLIFIIQLDCLCYL